MYVFCILQNNLQNTKCHNGNFFPNTYSLQTLSVSQLMFNKFKQDCFDIKATASRMIRLTVHFDEESLSVLLHGKKCNVTLTS